MTRQSLDRATVAPLLALLRAELPTGRRTLAQMETAVLELFPLLGPDLVETLAQEIEEPAPPSAAKKGGRRFVRVASPGVASPGASAPP